MRINFEIFSLGKYGLVRIERAGGNQIIFLTNPCNTINNTKQYRMLIVSTNELNTFIINF